MKESILFGRLGNKQQDIQFFKKYLPLDVKTIVEPFGGTFAITRLF
jgi:site-specific DNA-adenine methylase